MDLTSSLWREPAKKQARRAIIDGDALASGKTRYRAPDKRFLDGVEGRSRIASTSLDGSWIHSPIGQMSQYTK